MNSIFNIPCFKHKSGIRSEPALRFAPVCGYFTIVALKLGIASRSAEAGAWFPEIIGTGAMKARWGEGDCFAEPRNDGYYGEKVSFFWESVGKGVKEL